MTPGVEFADNAPMKLPSAIPSAAISIACKRVRYTPCSDVKPVMKAPIAAATPRVGLPSNAATISGIATPAVQRSA